LICQEVMEQAHPGEAAKEPEELQEWGDLEVEEWAAPEQAQVRQGSVSAPNVELPCLMRLEFPVTL